MGKSYDNVNIHTGMYQYIWVLEGNIIHKWNLINNLLTVLHAWFNLTLILLKQTWLVFATSIEPGQPAHHAVWPSSILLADHLQVLILISLNMIMDRSKNGRWIIPFKKFSRLKVNECCIHMATVKWYVS